MIASSVKAEVVKANQRAENDTGGPSASGLLTARIQRAEARSNMPGSPVAAACCVW